MLKQGNSVYSFREMGVLFEKWCYGFEILVQKPGL